MSVTAPVRTRRGVFHTLDVASVERLTDDSVAITFDIPDGLADVYRFAPGQSLTLRRWLDGREHRRTYSICAPAGAAPRIGVREIPEGLFSRWLTQEVRPGTAIDVQTPTGSFRADPTSGGRHLCIAAGSGITPILSIVSSILVNPDAQITLLYGNRRSSTVMFADELCDLKDRYGPRLQIAHVLSREPRDVELFTGRLDGDRLRQLLRVLVPTAALDDVWLCGPYAMTRDARDVLTEFGIADDRVHRELFYVDEPPPELNRAEPEATGETTEVSVVLDGRVSTGSLARDVPVLDAAQELRSDLPFACKGGVCGTCRALVREGEVRMRRNYALERSELEQGFVLTCQSLPCGKRLTIDYDA